MQEKKYAIKDWAKDDRPREKLLGKTPMALSNSELLAILIHHGTWDRSAIDLARDVLHLGDNDLTKLGKLSVTELTQVKGIGIAKAVTIAAAMELGRRREAAMLLDKPVIHSSRDVAHYLRVLYGDRQQELFLAVYLNRANHINHIAVISEGGLTSTIVDIRVILRKALEEDAISVILCHNHPSGNLSPSAADVELTERITKAAQLLDIQVLDHIIISQQGYLSFADEGII